ncbi:MAG: diguanylate cyclase [Candidatus Aenigmarchaeota archaeon]|nr:diguanylate cyclase [Candidatus Aenigmarchaeota archaeon]
MFAFVHVFDRQSFLFLLDLEIKRARRYQNYLSLLSLTLQDLNPSSGENPGVLLKNLVSLLKDELRDTDILGQSEGNRLLVMLPYADMAGVHKVREKFEKIFQDCGFGTEGLTVEIGEVCFPTHATNIEELLRGVGNNLPLSNP